MRESSPLEGDGTVVSERTTLLCTHDPRGGGGENEDGGENDVATAGLPEPSAHASHTSAAGIAASGVLEAGLSGSSSHAVNSMGRRAITRLGKLPGYGVPLPVERELPLIAARRYCRVSALGSTIGELTAGMRWTRRRQEVSIKVEEKHPLRRRPRRPG